MPSPSFPYASWKAKVVENNDDNTVVRVNCNYSAMRYWALQYDPYAEIISPENLRNQLKEDIKKIAEKYECIQK